MRGSTHSTVAGSSSTTTRSNTTVPLALLLLLSTTGVVVLLASCLLVEFAVMVVSNGLVGGVCGGIPVCGLNGPTRGAEVAPPMEICAPTLR